MIATQKRHLDNRLTIPWLAEAAWQMIKPYAGGFDDTPETMLHVMAIPVANYLASEQQEVHATVTDLAIQYSEAYLEWPPGTPLPAGWNLEPWKLLVRWSAFAVQCAGEDEAREFAAVIEQRMRNADASPRLDDAGGSGTPGPDRPAGGAAEAGPGPGPAQEQPAAAPKPRKRAAKPADGNGSPGRGRRRAGKGVPAAEPVGIPEAAAAEHPYEPPPFC